MSSQEKPKKSKTSAKSTKSAAGKKKYPSKKDLEALINMIREKATSQSNVVYYNQLQNLVASYEKREELMEELIQLLAEEDVECLEKKNDSDINLLDDKFLGNIEKENINTDDILDSIDDDNSDSNESSHTPESKRSSLPMNPATMK